MSELLPYSFKFLLSPDKLSKVASLLEGVPYSQMAIKSVKGTGTVAMRIILPRDTDMPKLFSGMRDVLNPPIPIDMAVREGVVFSQCKEPQSLSKPRPNPISLL